MSFPELMSLIRAFPVDALPWMVAACLYGLVRIEARVKQLERAVQDFLTSRAGRDVPGHAD